MPVINRGDDFFQVVTYTGNGTSQTISGLRFQPDLVWIKGRSGATDHALYDSSRGVQSRLESNTTDAQVTSDGGVTAFTADGFTVGSLAQVNTNGATYVAWCWKEGATQGFDIVTYTGTGAARTVAHNLGVAPDMIIVKNRSDGTVNWRVYHKSIGATNFLSLNLTNASAAASSVWNNTAPTSTVFSVANDGGSNGNGNNLVAYLFAAVSGFSSAFSYTGNGSTDGPFIFLGFRPRWIMVKRTDAAQNWAIIDTARDTFNVSNKRLFANLSDAEDTGIPNFIDVTANGFKCRDSNVSYNASGGTYIGFAIAENPFKFSLGR